MINRTLFLFTLALLCGCGQPAPPAQRNANVERIISLAPNITETVYILGLEDKLVGVTPYCTYPEAARTLPKVGGFGHISYEAIVSARPDLVILHKEWDAEKVRLAGLDIPYLETGSYFITDILETINRIGNACGEQDQAEKLIAQLNRRMNELATTSTNLPRVLITFGSDGSGPIQAFGPACIHNEMLEIAGGANVVKGSLPFATLSYEAVIRLNPDIIIVLAPELESPGSYSGPWDKLESVSAVKHNRIHVLTADYTCIPGPRFIQTLEKFAVIIRQNNLEAE
jgi:iron complex transport system substrate-binding protein